MKEVIWIADSEDRLAEMPDVVKNSFGYNLWRVQEGVAARDSKMLPSIGRGVWELRESFDSKPYRLMYVVNLASAHLCAGRFHEKIGIRHRFAETGYRTAEVSLQTSLTEGCRT